MCTATGLKWVKFPFLLCKITNKSDHCNLNSYNIFLLKYRSSRLRMFCIISGMKAFTKFTGKNCAGVFFSQVRNWKPVNLLSNRDSGNDFFL